MAVFAPSKGCENLETLHGLHNELESLDSRDIVERKSEIDVQYIAEP